MNGFHNLNNLSDRPLNAAVAVGAWLALAVALLRFGARPFNWIIAAMMTIVALGMW